MRMTWTLLALLAVAPGAVMAQDVSCDDLWSYFDAAPLAMPERPEGVGEPVYRYIAGAEAYASAYEAVKDLSADDFVALDGSTQMVTALSLNFGDRLMTCYHDAAMADPDRAAFVETTETEFPPAGRADIVGTYRLRQ